MKVKKSSAKYVKRKKKIYAVYEEIKVFLKNEIV